MASDFNILIHRNSDNVHLRLDGDFNDFSAGELLDAINKCVNGAYRIIIHSSCLKSIYPFDRNKFHRDLRDLEKNSFRIMFTGENAGLFVPEKFYKNK